MKRYGIFFLFSLFIRLQLQAQHVGIGTSTPNQKLTVQGKIKIADDATAPTAGTVRWNSTTKDFEGFDGTTWYSLTNKLQVTAPWPMPGTTGNFTGYSQLFPNDPSDDNFFASCMDLDAGKLVIGSPGKGAVYVFEKNPSQVWVQVQKITSHQTGIPNPVFGWSVAIHGNYMVVGSRNYWPEIYFYTGSTWRPLQTLTEIDLPSNVFGTAAETGFGWELDISGDYLVVGAEKANGQKGKAYIYKRSDTTWPRQQILNPNTINNINNQHHFGSAVSIDQDYIAVGAEGQSDVVNGGPPVADSSHGAVYVFERGATTWSQHSRVKPSDYNYGGTGSGKSSFGSAVAVEYKGSLLVGAEDEGHLYFYEFISTGFVYQFRFPVNADRVVMAGDLAAAITNFHESQVGASVVNAKSSCSVFKRINRQWVFGGSFNDPGGADIFASSVAIDGNRILAGTTRYQKNTGNTIITTGRVVQSTIY